MARSGTTAILGAGFSQSMGFPGTIDLTDEVRKLQSPQLPDDLPPPLAKAKLADMLWRMISPYYETPNFEIMLHAIEAMLSVQSGAVGVELSDDVKPIVNAFMDVTPRWIPLASSAELRRLASSITSTVAERLRERRSELDFSAGAFPANSAALTSWRVGGPLNLINLNYDTSLYEMFPQAIDGYTIEGDGYASFDYRSLVDHDDVDFLLHLHGSVRYGFEPLKAEDRSGLLPEELAALQSRRKLVKFADTNSASVYWHINNEIDSQAGERVFVGPIVTGLRKTEKTLYGPYGYYLHMFINSLLSSPRLVLCGYGGKDTYINHWIGQWLLHHNAAARCAIISRSSALEKPTNARALLDFAAHAAQSENPASDLDATMVQQDVLSAVQADGWTTKGRCMIVGGEGFPLSEARSQAIAQFLSE